MTTIHIGDPNRRGFAGYPEVIPYGKFKAQMLLASPPAKKKGRGRSKGAQKSYRSYVPSSSSSWRTTGASPPSILASAIRETRKAMATPIRPAAGRRSGRIADRIKTFGHARNYNHLYKFKN